MPIDLLLDTTESQVPVPYGWGSTDLPPLDAAKRLTHQPAPDIECFPAYLWSEIESAPAPAVAVAAHGAKPKAKAAAKSLVMCSAARVTGKKTKGELSPDRATLYQRASVLMEEGKSLRAAAQEVGVPASSLRGWLKRR